MKGVVLDNSAAISLGASSMGDTEEVQYFAPELIDLEYASMLRKLVIRKEFSPDVAGTLVREWAANSLVRCSHTLLLTRIWELREDITPYDAAYVALAESLGIPLMTADRRLARAAAQYCEVITLGD